MTDFPLVVTALALLLGSIEPAPQHARERVAAVPRVPILMYHVIADPPPGAPWPQLYVSPAEFEAQVAWLEQQGFTAVTLSDVWHSWHDGGSLPKRPVVFTFDDGYRSVATKALPILRRRGWPAVLNLKVGNLEPGSFTESDVRRLLAAGWELGAHTITHPDLRTLDDARARARGRRLARRDPTSVRCPGRLLLLPGRPLRRPRARRSSAGGLPRRDHDDRRSRDGRRPIRAQAHPRQPRRRCPRAG